MKLLVLLLALLLVHAAAAFDVIDVINLNTSNLPANGTLYLNLSLAENQTANLTLVMNDSRVNLTYPQVVQFVNSSSAQVQIGWAVENFSTFQNVTLNSSLNITNDYNNLSFTYGIVVNISSPGYLIETPVFNLNVLNQNYVINVSTNLLPFSGALMYNISGYAGQTIRITCAGWLSCPSNITFPSDANTTLVQIEYIVPLAAPLGNSSSPLSFVSANSSVNTSVYFTIMETDLLLQEFVWRSECFNNETGDVKLSCLQDYENFQVGRLSQVIRRAQALGNITCGNTTEYVPNYVVTGSVDKDIWDELQTCRTDRSSLSIRVESCTTSLKSTTDDYTGCQDTYMLYRNQTVENEQKSQMQCNQDKTLITERADKKIRNWIIAAIIIAVLTILGIRIYNNREETSWGA